MKLERLLEVVGDEPVFESGLLMAGPCDPGDIQRQLCRWTDSGILWQLRRGIYCLAPPYQKVKPHPFVLAGALARPSYVSLQSALGYWQLIPEHVPVVTSVTTRRPCEYVTTVGRFLFRHVRKPMFTGYSLIEVAPGQRAFVASPEKALLDLFHLEAGSDAPDYLASLRIQDGDRLDLDALLRLAIDTGRPKLLRAARRLGEILRRREEEYEVL